MILQYYIISYMFYLKVKDEQNKFNTIFSLVYKFHILLPFSLMITIANLINNKLPMCPRKILE